MLAQLDVLIGLSLVLAGASMIVTLIVQAVVGFLGLRGTNLRWGVELLLQQSDSSGELRGCAREVAEAALRHPLVSDSIGSTRRRLASIPILGSIFRRWTLAKAVRPEELIVVLKRLAAPPQAGATDPAWRQGLVRALQRQDAATLVQNAAGAAGARGLPSSVIDAIAKQIDPWLAASAGGLADLRLWFDSTMDRVSQRFTTHTRIATVIGSFVLALALQLDVLALQGRLAADPPLRAALVTQAQEASKADPAALEAEYVPRALSSVLSPDDASKHAAEFDAIRTDDDAKLWLASFAGDDPNKLRELRGRLELALLRERTTEIRNQAARLADLCLVPWPANDRCDPPDRFRHLTGILVSALLLCLGAPFWFNLLKTLVSLRPVLARKTGDEPPPR